jgi:hypothetical protein
MDSRRKVVKKTPDELLIEVEKRIDYFRDRGYNIKYIWECKFLREKRQDPNLKLYMNKRFEYYEKLNKYGSTNIKESFFGGRTNNLQFYKKIESEDEEIKYVDFCSLYPYVLKTKTYPMKHPEVISENYDYTLKSYFGFVKCKVVPPRGLYLPVLPVVIDGKLMFPLCRSCAQENNDNCDHTDEERMLIGTWTTIELVAALERGYKLDEIIEVLNYKEKGLELFVGYVNMWLKIKQEASGCPALCKTDEEKEQYLNKYYKHENIELDREKIEKNSALRFIVKIMLNSFCGKLAQRINLPKTKTIDIYYEHWRITSDINIEIVGEMMINEDKMMLTFGIYRLI